jgi:hypothetical protein
MTCSATSDITEPGTYCWDVTITETSGNYDPSIVSLTGSEDSDNECFVVESVPLGVEGFMVGGGHVITSSNSNIEENNLVNNAKKNAKVPANDTFRVSHGFELHCNSDFTPNNLQVNWLGNSFHMENLELATCLDDGTSNEPPKSPHPGPTLDVYMGEGSGRLNGNDGAFAEWIFTDNGEPGKSDEIVKLIIKNENGDIVLEISEPIDLKGGNHQFVPHKSSHHKVMESSTSKIT